MAAPANPAARPATTPMGRATPRVMLASAPRATTSLPSESQRAGTGAGTRPRRSPTRRRGASPGSTAGASEEVRLSQPVGPRRCPRSRPPPSRAGRRAQRRGVRRRAGACARGRTGTRPARTAPRRTAGRRRSPRTIRPGREGSDRPATARSGPGAGRGEGERRDDEVASTRAPRRWAPGTRGVARRGEQADVGGPQVPRLHAATRGDPVVAKQAKFPAVPRSWSAPPALSGSVAGG